MSGNISPTEATTEQQNPRRSIFQSINERRKQIPLKAETSLSSNFTDGSMASPGLDHVTINMSPSIRDHDPEGWEQVLRDSSQQTNSREPLNRPQASRLNRSMLFVGFFYRRMYQQKILNRIAKLENEQKKDEERIQHYQSQIERLERKRQAFIELKPDILNAKPMQTQEATQRMDLLDWSIENFKLWKSEREDSLKKKESLIEKNDYILYLRYKESIYRFAIMTGNTVMWSMTTISFFTKVLIPAPMTEDQAPPVLYERMRTYSTFTDAFCAVILPVVQILQGKLHTIQAELLEAEETLPTIQKTEIYEEPIVLGRKFGESPSPITVSSPSSNKKILRFRDYSGERSSDEEEKGKMSALHYGMMTRSLHNLIETELENKNIVLGKTMGYTLGDVKKILFHYTEAYREAPDTIDTTTEEHLADLLDAIDSRKTETKVFCLREMIQESNSIRGRKSSNGSVGSSRDPIQWLIVDQKTGTIWIPLLEPDDKRDDLPLFIESTVMPWIMQQKRQGCVYRLQMASVLSLELPKHQQLDESLKSTVLLHAVRLFFESKSKDDAIPKIIYLPRTPDNLYSQDKELILSWIQNSEKDPSYDRKQKQKERLELLEQQINDNRVSTVSALPSFSAIRERRDSEKTLYHSAEDLDTNSESEDRRRWGQGTSKQFTETSQPIHQRSFSDGPGRRNSAERRVDFP